METTQTNAAEQGHEQDRALVPVTRYGAPWVEGLPTVLSAGADTIECSFDVEVSEAMWQRLEQERQVAELLMKERHCVHVPDWLNAQIHPTGARGGYRFLLETPDFAVGVPNRPPIYVELRAFGLHTHAGGELAAVEAACAYIREVLLADQDPEWAAQAITPDTARCSRLDLYVDWQGGWHPDFAAGGDERCFVKRVHAAVDRHSVDSHVTGFDIGKSAVRARLYNKTVEMRKGKNEWYPELLAARHGDRFDVAQDLWRLEFQLRREGVKGFRLRATLELDDPDEVIDAELAAEDLPHLHSVRKALHWAGHLWDYLTRHWLRLVVPTQDANRGRWPEHSTLAALRMAFSLLALRGAPALPEADRELVRAARYSGYRRLLDRMAAGLLTTEQAMDTDPGAAMVTWVAWLHQLAGRIRRQQKRRARQWAQLAVTQDLTGKALAIVPDLSRGMGARLDAFARIRKGEQLLEMALSVFDAAGVVRLRLHREADVASVSDLLVYSLEELEAVAAQKGGIRRLLEEKWEKVYKASSPRGLFSRAELRQAA
jgi:hypothetical protein